MDEYANERAARQARHLASTRQRATSVYDELKVHVASADKALSRFHTEETKVARQKLKEALMWAEQITRI